MTKDYLFFLADLSLGDPGGIFVMFYNTQKIK